MLNRNLIALIIFNLNRLFAWERKLSIKVQISMSLFTRCTRWKNIGAKMVIFSTISVGSTTKVLKKRLFTCPSETDQEIALGWDLQMWVYIKSKTLNFICIKVIRFSGSWWLLLNKGFLWIFLDDDPFDPRDYDQKFQSHFCRRFRWRRKANCSSKHSSNFFKTNSNQISENLKKYLENWFW